MHGSDKYVRCSVHTPLPIWPYALTPVAGICASICGRHGRGIVRERDTILKYDDRDAWRLSTLPQEGSSFGINDPSPRMTMYIYIAVCVCYKGKEYNDESFIPLLSRF